MSRRLTTALGAEHLVARVGGDEFVVLVEHGADDETLGRVADAALAAVRRPVWLDDNEVTVSASVGVVQAGDTAGHGYAELMKAADTTLYRAKADGRDRCFATYDDRRHRDDLSRFELSARMPEALAGGEFELDHQPLVRLRDRRMVGVAALVRWRLPDGRRLDPGRFVPLVEDNGFIVELGRWVLDRACRQAAAWVAADPAARLLLSVTVAARQVQEHGLVDEVAALLADTGWPPELLQLELTESAPMDTPDGSPAVLNGLADMGVRFAIDDLGTGTGYSNLAYLRRLPVHVLTLAGSSITGAAGQVAVEGDPDDLPTDPAPTDPAPTDPGPTDHIDREVVGLVIRLAHTLGLTVTAESVETPAHCAHLQQLGCDIGQGWFFARAVGPAAIPRPGRPPAGRARGARVRITP